MNKPISQAKLNTIIDKASKVVSITNISKQMIPIQLRPPVGADGKRLDFYIGQRTINMSPGQSDSFKEDELINDQIANLKKKGMIRVSKSR